MFSKSKIQQPGPKAPEVERPAAPEVSAPRADAGITGAPKPKPPASVLSADLTITGNLKTSGDVVVDGVVDGDIRAHLLTVGEGATIRGEIVADDIVVNGRVIGRVRGLKVRLTSTARVEGDVIHKTIAIESGAHFEGSVQRQEDPLSGATPSRQPAAAAAAAATAARQATPAASPAAAAPRAEPAKS